MPDHFEIDEDIPSEAYRVAAMALREIGQPSIEEMLLRIKKSDLEEERNIAAWVIKEIEGKEQALHRLRAMARRGGRGKKRYEAARQFVDAYKPIFEHPDKIKERK